jgi:hypothetical protein
MQIPGGVFFMLRRQAVIAKEVEKKRLRLYFARVFHGDIQHSTESRTVAGPV